jgi:hypothetical protein
LKAKGSTSKTKTVVFGLLRELAAALPGALGADPAPLAAVVGCCRLTASNHVLKAPMVSALDAAI